MASVQLHRLYHSSCWLLGSTYYGRTLVLVELTLIGGRIEGQLRSVRSPLDNAHARMFWISTCRRLCCTPAEEAPSLSRVLCRSVQSLRCLPVMDYGLHSPRKSSETSKWKAPPAHTDSRTSPAWQRGDPSLGFQFSIGRPGHPWPLLQPWACEQPSTPVNQSTIIVSLAAINNKAITATSQVPRRTWQSA